MHECDVGGVPRGRNRIRQCTCGNWFIYGHGVTGLGLLLWRRMGPFSLFLHRREIARIPGDFLNLSG
jgi:hypothetical protein